MEEKVFPEGTTYLATFMSTFDAAESADRYAATSVVPTRPLAPGSQASFNKLSARMAASAKEPEIAFVPAATDFGLYSPMIHGIQSVARHFDTSAMVLGPSGNGNNDTQVGILDVLVNSEPSIDGLIIDVGDAERAAPVIHQAVEAGILVVIANSDVQRFPTPVHAVVGYAQRDANRAMGDYAGRLTAGSHTLVGILEGLPGYHSAEAVAGFREGIARHRHLSFAGSRQGGWTVDGGQAAAEALLLAYPALGMIWAANDNMIMGAYAAAEASGRSDLILLGRDGDPDALQMVADHQLKATVDTDPTAIGAASSKIVFEAFAGQFRGGFVETPTAIVDAYNVYHR